jgi:hypothetical protein
MKQYAIKNKNFFIYQTNFAAFLLLIIMGTFHCIFNDIKIEILIFLHKTLI